MMSPSWKRSLGITVLALLVVLPLAVAAGDQVRLEAVLAGTAADPQAFGEARVDLEDQRARVEVRIEAITHDTMVYVVVGANLLGSIELDDQGRGSLRLDSQNGDEVPLIQAGDAVGLYSVNDLTLLAEGVLEQVN